MTLFWPCLCQNALIDEWSWYGYRPNHLQRWKLGFRVKARMIKDLKVVGRGGGGKAGVSAHFCWLIYFAVTVCVVFAYLILSFYSQKFLFTSALNQDRAQKKKKSFSNILEKRKGSHWSFTDFLSFVTNINKVVHFLVWLYIMANKPNILIFIEY